MEKHHAVIDENAKCHLHQHKHDDLQHLLHLHRHFSGKQIQTDEFIVAERNVRADKARPTQQQLRHIQAPGQRLADSTAIAELNTSATITAKRKENRNSSALQYALYTFSRRYSSSTKRGPPLSENGPLVLIRWVYRPISA